MYAVSEAYKRAIQLHREYGVRNGWKKQIYLGQFDSLARNDATVTASAEASYSDASILNTSTTQACSYTTFEGNSFRLDGKQYLMPQENHLQQGFISKGYSGADGSFDENPTITVVFGEPHSMVGITILFDDTADLFASEYIVTTWLNGIKVISHVISNDSPKSTPELGLTNFDRMVIEFTKTVRPYQRIHVQNIAFGIGYSFEDEDIMSINVDRETSPVGLELPKTDISFSLFNIDGRFDVDAAVPIVEFLKGDQYVDVTFLYDVSGKGDYEAIKMPRMWLKSWSVDGIKATFKCRDVFSRYSDKKYEISTYGEKTALQLIEETMLDAGVTNYEADGALLSAISTMNPLPVVTHSECWQLVANLAMATLEEDEDGTIIFRYRIDPTLDDVQLSPTICEYVNSENITAYEDPIKQYAAFEEDFFALDGSMILMPTEGYQNVGAVWDFDAEPVITMEFDENSTIGAVNLTFDKYATPKEVQIQAFRYADGEYDPILDNPYPVLGPAVSVTDKFDRVKQIVVRLIGNEKQQRPRMQRVAITWDSGFEITDKDILGNPHGEVLTACRNVVATLTNLSAGEEGQITKKTVIAGETTRLQHGTPATNISVTTETEGAVVSFTPYAYYTDVLVTGAEGEIEVTVMGQRLTDESMKTAQLAVSYNGEDCEIENPLLNDSSLSPEYLQWNADYLGSRVEWEVETLGYPELQPGDRILYKGSKAYVKRTVIDTSSGSMRGKLILRRRGYT